ncbi:hypothetical protein K438DRAFT_1873191 [Mycena galopus ATCC 62051]|nr:hypothetical protein K438DRAFT_1873191 [Mycena galopus ATCC 62051]
MSLHSGNCGQGLDEDLHAATETEDKVKGGLFLDVLVGKLGDGQQSEWRQGGCTMHPSLS